MSRKIPCNDENYVNKGPCGHDVGPYYPVTIKTVGDGDNFVHIACLGHEESGRFDSFTECELFAKEVKKHLDAKGDAEVKMLFGLSRGEFLQ